MFLVYLVIKIGAIQMFFDDDDDDSITTQTVYVYRTLTCFRFT